MANINSYLTFNGNCEEAMVFYQNCFGGALTFQTIGESPIAEKMPTEMKNCILHAVLISDDMVLMATDMTANKGLIKGNSVSLMLNCNSEEEVIKYYKKLSVGGEATHALEVTFWGAVFGDLIDQYGNSWLLSYNKSNF